jgi:hypothetical protein
MNQLINLKSLILIPLALVCFALTPKVIAKGMPQSCNTSDGFQALSNLTTGTNDTAVGGNALFSNTTGADNTAVGCGALEFNVDGTENTATGGRALRSNVTGVANTATGVEALGNNTSGNENAAFGGGALQKNTTGNNNTAVGIHALDNKTTGNGNIALGFQAGVNLITGSDNIYIGNSGGFPGESGTIRIGTQGSVDIAGQTLTFIAGISDTLVPSENRPVIIGRDGQLGTVVSSARFKEEIKPMDKTSEAILALKPVTFRYKKELDPKRVPQFGLVAEEVEKVNPDLITRDRDGKPYTVRYEEVNTMLLNEFLKAHRRIEEQQKEIEALIQLIQKVSDKVEMTKPAPQVARNDE